MISDAMLERFSRQVLVPGFDLEGQQALACARVAVVGCGGLGNLAALYLAAAGIGFIRLIDDDVVEPSNLPRQIAFTESHLGMPKAEMLASAMTARWSAVTVDAVVKRLTAANIRQLLAEVDVVVDATDNREARLLIDVATAASRVPWIMGAALQMTGQNMLFDAEREYGCYHCLYPQSDTAPRTCGELGVLGPVVGIIALHQALDVIKLLTGCGSLPWGMLRLVDFREDEHQRVLLTPRPDCSLCGTGSP